MKEKKDNEVIQADPNLIRGRRRKRNLVSANLQTATLPLFWSWSTRRWQPDHQRSAFATQSQLMRGGRGSVRCGARDLFAAWIVLNSLFTGMQLYVYS
jgi:hypothetical protein